MRRTRKTPDSRICTPLPVIGEIVHERRVRDRIGGPEVGRVVLPATPGNPPTTRKRQASVPLAWSNDLPYGLWRLPILPRSHKQISRISRVCNTTTNFPTMRLARDVAWRYSATSHCGGHRVACPWHRGSGSALEYEHDKRSSASCDDGENLTRPRWRSMATSSHPETSAPSPGSVRTAPGAFGRPARSGGRGNPGRIAVPGQWHFGKGGQTDDRPRPRSRVIRVSEAGLS